MMLEKKVDDPFSEGELPVEEFWVTWRDQIEISASGDCFLVFRTQGTSNQLLFPVRTPNRKFDEIIDCPFSGRGSKNRRT